MKMLITILLIKIYSTCIFCQNYIVITGKNQIAHLMPEDSAKFYPFNLKNKYKSAIICCEDNMSIPNLFFSIKNLEDIFIVGKTNLVDQRYLNFKELKTLEINVDSFGRLNRNLWKLKKLRYIDINSNRHSREVMEDIKFILSRRPKFTIAIGGKVYSRKNLQVMGNVSN